MAKEGLRYQLFSRRAFLIALAQAAGFSLLGTRLYYLSVVKGESYRLRADQNRIGLRLIVPERGEVLDRNSVPLAANRQDYRILFVPEEAQDVEATLTQVAGLVGINPQKQARILQQIKRQPRFWSVTLANQLSWDAFSRVSVHLPDLPGVHLNAGLSRFYPFGEMLGHVVGYLGRPPAGQEERKPLFRQPGFQVGREGLENVFEEHLRGLEGSRRVEVNSVGREIRELPPRQNAVKGNQLQLTLDIRLQQFAMMELGEQSAAVVVMDIETGDIHALASAPTFDSNEFTTGMSRENWQALLSDPRKPLLNKAIAGQFPPGSTIKMAVALSALEQGIASSDTVHYCNGHHTLGRHRFHCWKRGGHGRLDMVGALANSCDVYFYKLAEKMDIDQIANMARRLGLGQMHDIALEGQKNGLVPDKRWKRDFRNASWQGGDTLNVSIGQGAMLATPLQLAVMTARIASGRSVSPRLIMDEEKRNGGPLEINPLHLQTVREGMIRVTSVGGTAYDPQRPRTAVSQAGKTGTAQVRRITKTERDSGVLKNDELPWQSRDHALYVGYAPVEAPRYAVSVLVQHGGSGSGVAAPIARKLLDEALRLEAENADRPTAVYMRDDTAGSIELAERETRTSQAEDRTPLYADVPLNSDTSLEKG